MERRKIFIVTHCLQPGEDGVGDYCRELAGELCESGVNATLVGLKDRSQAKSENEIRFAEEDSIRRGLVYIKNERSPSDLVSLHLSPFGWNNRGILRDLSREIVSSGLPIHHVHAHELSVGTTPRSSLRHRALGIIQARYIKKILRQRCVTTTNEYYRSVLSRWGIQADVIPLFAFPKLVQGAMAPFVRNEETTYFVVFGSLHDAWWKPDVLKRVLHSFRNPTLIQIGRHRNDKVALSLEQLDVPVIRLGPRSGLEISGVLQEASIGLTTNPPELLGKSGTTTAMLEHGLPVIVTRPPFNTGYTLPENVFDLSNYKQAARHEPKSRRPETIQSWLRVLQGH